MQTKTLALLNTAGFVLTVVVNYLAVALPINGYTTGELSRLYPNYFVPAGFTFGIWGVIYTLLLLFTGYQLWAAWRGRPEDQAVVQRIGPWFVVSCLANAGWIFVWHHLQVALSLLVMLGILGSLISIYLRLGTGERPVANAKETWMVRVPFSVYLGWISVATIANATTLLVVLGWDGGPIAEIQWAGLLIGVAAILGLVVLWKRQDIAFALVLIWAFYGIYSRQTMAGTEAVRPIILTAAIAMGVLGSQVLLKAIGWVKRAD